jgi:hypothetical protein
MRRGFPFLILHRFRKYTLHGSLLDDTLNSSKTLLVQVDLDLFIVVHAIGNFRVKVTQASSFYLAWNESQDGRNLSF